MSNKIVFSNPVEFEGKKYTDLTIDLDSLTGNDLLAVEREVRAMGDKNPVPELSKQYLAAVGARAAKVPVEMVLSLPAKYFSKITLLVQGFFVPEE